jgi:hypothetical protein
LFNALLKKQAALAASYPFATIEPNVGVVPVPDENLEKLLKTAEEEYAREMDGQEIKVVPATVKFYDIAGLVAGAHKGEGLGNQFLSHIREVDAILHLVRDFDDENVPRAGSVSPQKDQELITTELLLADLQTIEKRLGGKKQKDEAVLLEKIKAHLEAGNSASEYKPEPKEEEYFSQLHLLSAKPKLYVLNVSEEKLTEEDANKEGMLKICAKVESDLASFDKEDRESYLKQLGLKESGLNKVIKAGYKLLNLQSFYTYGPKEIRAWTIESGATALGAAAKIHTDFAKGFIKAEVISCEELIKAGGWRIAKETGTLRLEGKEYLMQKDDVVVFRFNL